MPTFSKLSPTNSAENTAEWQPSEDKFKGHGDLNISEITSTLQYLKRHASMRLSEMTPEVQAEFKKIVNHVSLTSTTGRYRDLYSLMQETFREVDPVTEGTIASYIKSCNADQLLGRGNPCYFPCVNAAPHPDRVGEVCKDKIVYANYSKTSNGFVFSYPNGNGTTGDKALVYVNWESDKATTDSKALYSQFPGFSQAEINELKSKDINKVTVYYFNNGNTQEIYSGSLSGVKGRGKRDGVTGWGGLGAAGVVLLFIIIVLIMIAASSRRSR